MGERDSVLEAIHQINHAWLDGRASDMAPLVHESVVVVLPGFSGRVIGRDAFVASYADFASEARVSAYDESEHVVDVFGATSRRQLIVRGLAAQNKGAEPDDCH